MNQNVEQTILMRKTLLHNVTLSTIFRVYGQMHDNNQLKSSSISDEIDYAAGKRRYSRCEEAKGIAI